MVLIRMLAFTFFVTGCGLVESTSSPDAIIGEDNRSSMNPAFRTVIGSLRIEEQDMCTVFASGSDQVTTAAHCILSEVDLADYSIKWADGRRTAVNGILFLNDRSDVAILSARGVRDHLTMSDSPITKNKTTILSFAQDRGVFVQSVAETVTLLPSRQVLSHDADSVPGSSGSPIIQNGKVIGVHIGTKHERNFATVIAAIDHFTSREIEDLARELLHEVGRWAAKKIVQKVGEKVGADMSGLNDTIGLDPHERENSARDARDIDNRSREADSLDPNTALR